MPTKVQAKAAVDNAATLIKADIDNTLPVGVNIVDGNISFSPSRWSIVMDAGGLIAAAETLVSQITTNLTTQSRTYTIARFRRGDDGQRVFAIFTQQATYRIINF